MTEGDCPFVRGKRYEILKSISELGSNFSTGESFVFKTAAYDPHNGVTRFWFIPETGEEAVIWHVWDSDLPTFEHWEKYFRECK